jgi:hypothetical protein
MSEQREIQHNKDDDHKNAEFFVVAAICEQEPAIIRKTAERIKRSLMRERGT